MRMVDHLMIGANVSVQSIPFFCWNPLATKRAFLRSGAPSKPGFSLYTHFVVMGFFPSGRVGLEGNVGASGICGSETCPTGLDGVSGDISISDDRVGSLGPSIYRLDSAHRILRTILVQ